MSKATIVFNSNKGENPKSKANKKLHRKLQEQYKCRVNKDGLSLESLEGANVLIFLSPKEEFSGQDVCYLQDFLSTGGSILFLLSADAGIDSLGPKFASLMSGIGITTKNDCVVSLSHSSKALLHPKHVLISKDGILHPALDAVQSFVYPNGSTLKVDSPSVAILSTDQESFPAKQPIAAAWEGQRVNDTTAGGRVLVIGSADVFSNDFITENDKLCDILFSFLLNDAMVWFPRNMTSSNGVDDDNKCAPDIASLADRVKLCLEELDPLPRDFNRLFCDNLFGFDTSLVPDAIKLYEELDVSREPLSLIPPEFECPMPPLRPAVFSPQLPDPPIPALDRFNLDDCFSDKRTKLAQLTNKCCDADGETGCDLDYYVREAGQILGLSAAAAAADKDDKVAGKKILSIVFSKIAHCKRRSSRDFVLLPIQSVDVF